MAPTIHTGSARLVRSFSAGGTSMKTDRLLVGLDFGAASVTAARWASEWFAPDAEFLLAHVIEPPDRPHFAHDKLPPEEALEATAREYAAARLREINSEL